MAERTTAYKMRHTRVDKENHNSPEQKFTSRNLHGNPCGGQEARTVTDELPEGHSGQLSELKTPGAFHHRGTPILG